jgi:hypothetical protein
MEDSFQPIPNWSDVALLAAIEQAFDATWPVIRAREAGNNKARMAELSMALSHRLVELAANGVTDPHELQRLALETFPVTPPRVMSPKETVPGGLS